MSHFSRVDSVKLALPVLRQTLSLTRVVGNLSNTPASEQPHHVMGPVLYSFSEVLGGMGATQPPVVATLHQPVKDTSPRTPGPRTGCRRGAGRLGDASSSLPRALGSFSV